MARTMGVAALRVLQAIGQGKEYGFDIIEATALPSGTVYPALSKHERDGLVRSSWEDAELAHRDGRPPRRYYRLTPQGKKAIERTLAALGVSSGSRARTARARGESW